MNWGENCRLCGANSETVRHVLVCPALSDRRDLIDNDCISTLHRYGIKVRSFPDGPYPPALSPSTSSLGRAKWVHWVPLWFRPGTDLHMQVCISSAVPPTHEFSDALARAVGVLPRWLDDLLLRTLSPRGLWVQRELTDIEAVRHSLQLILLRGTLSLYQARCRLVDAWWDSPAAEEFRINRVRLLAQLKAARKNRNFPNAAHRRRPRGTTPSRRSPRAPQPRLFSYPMVDFSIRLPCEYEMDLQRLGNTLPWY